MASKSDYFKVFILRTVGNFLLLSALAGMVMTFAPAAFAEARYRYDQLAGRNYYVAGEVSESKLVDTGPTLAITPVDSSFGLVIPKINANTRVIANVDPGNYDAYIGALKQGVAHAAGTVYPGQNGNSVLFAHSVGNFWEVNQWNAVFYLLRELDKGDNVYVFYQGKKYVYEVTGKQIVEPRETGYLQPQAGYPKLTLQTCWPPGTTLKRLLVFARLKTT